VGKYPDRDYSLKGLGMRIDALEEHRDENKELIETIKTVIKLVKIWGPILTASMLGGTAVNPNVWKFLLATFHAIQ
jgi:hypothetical protein